MIEAFILAVYVIIGCITADQCCDGNIIDEVLIALFWPAVVVLMLFTFTFLG